MWEARGHEVLLLGDSVVGKTCLHNRYLKGPAGFSRLTWSATEEFLVGVKTKIVYQDRDRAVKFLVWETPDRESFRSLVRPSYTPAEAAIIVYDITQQDSLRNARKWLYRLRSECRPNIFKALAGNKADLVNERKVTFEDGQSFAHDNDVDLFMEVSALTGENVEKLFSTVVDQLEMELTLTKTIRKDSKALNMEGKRLLRISYAVTKLMTEVEILNLSHNELAKLPRSTSNLSNLTKLNLNHNKLTQFPEVVVTLINLTHLFVNDNELSTLPEKMKNLENLEELELRNNKMKKVFKYIVDLHRLKKLSVTGNPLTFEEIGSLVILMDLKPQRMSIDIAGWRSGKDSAREFPVEIQAKGGFAKLLYEEALKDGSVNVYRGRVLLVGQDRAGKTSLKKSLLGLPFNPKEESTEGIEVDPSVCEIEVEQVKNWNSTSENKPSLAEFSEDISRMLAEKQYHWIVNEVKEDSGMESKLELTGEESTMELGTNSSDMNQVPENVGNLKNSTISPPESEMRVQAVTKTTVEDPPDDSSVSSSKNSTLMMDATSPPDDVTKHAYQRLKDMLEGVHGDAENAADKRETIVTVDLWDFAGQHLYYASHPVFLSSRAVYVLVHNLSKALDAPAQPCVRQGTRDKFLENPNNDTNLENLLSWLVTIHSIRPTGEEMVGNSGDMLPYLRPPVFIVGTHADKPFEDIQAMTSKIQQAIYGKDYEKHVIRPFFSIDNTLGDESWFRKVMKWFAGQESDPDVASGDGIHALRTKIMDVLRQEPYMGEKIPVK